jgi:hypothetical protein
MLCEVSLKLSHLTEGPWLREFVLSFSLRSPEFYPKPVRVGFVVDEVAQGQVPLRAALFSLSHDHSTIASFSSSS